MRCYSIRKKLYRYADGESKPSEREVITLHLNTCSFCRNKLAEIQSLNELLTDPNLPEVPPHIHEKILFQTKNKMQRKQVHSKLRWNLIPVAASLVISLYFGISLGTKTLPLTVAKMEISSLDFDQQTLYAEEDSQEDSK
jgi:predicted anti-sigma-YlaC factor YlaD